MKIYQEADKKHVLIAALLLFVLFSGSALSFEMTVKRIASYRPSKKVIEKPGQLPHSVAVRGRNNIRTAWFSGATKRYGHGVLGDFLEASVLSVEIRDGKTIRKILPPNRVFEDLKPRINDLNGDNKDDIIVVESDVVRGASLSVYTQKNDRLVLLAATPFLGVPNRWLNPVGAGDFDGDGKVDIALVATPHLGGILRLYKLKGKTLKLFAEYEGVSTHRIGSTELGLGAVFKSKPRDLIVLPNQSHRVLLLLKWTVNGIKELAKVRLNDRLISSLVFVKKGVFRFRLRDKRYYELVIR